MNKIYTFLIALTFSSGLFAQTIYPEQAESAVLNFYINNGSDNYLDYGQFFKNTVTADSLNQCDTLFNFNGSPTYYSIPAGGYLTGQCSAGYDEYAEKYSSVTKPYVYGLKVVVAKADYFSPSSKITFKVYDGGSTPGTVLATQDVLYSSLNVGGLSTSDTIEFSSPVSTTGEFYIGYEVYYESPQDTFAIYMTQFLTTLINTAYYHSSTGWHPFTDLDPSGITDYSSNLALKALVCETSNGITDPDEQQISVFPNPANNILNIIGIQEELNVVIYDVHGRIALHENVQGSIDISDLPIGIFLLRAFDNSGNIVLNTKFQKQ